MIKNEIIINVIDTVTAPVLSLDKPKHIQAGSGKLKVMVALSNKFKLMERDAEVEGDILKLYVGTKTKNEFTTSYVLNADNNYTVEVSVPDTKDGFIDFMVGFNGSDDSNAIFISTKPLHIDLENYFGIGKINDYI